MADTFIQLPADSTGKKVRAFSSTVGPDTVHSQANTIVDATGNVMSDLTPEGSIKVTTTASNDGTTDAFSRVRMAQPTVLWDGSTTYDKNPHDWRELLATGGTATFNANESTVSMTTNTTSGSRVVRQSRYYTRYHPGMSQFIVATAVFGAGEANNVQRVGYFDNNNGLFFEQNGTTMRVVRRTNVTGTPVDNAVAQASWNIDPLDGTGPSGETLVPTNDNIYIIDLQWLGAGKVRYGVIIGGRVYYCHELDLGNTLTVPFMSRATLPVRYENVNVGATGGSNTLKAICASVLIEGGMRSDRDDVFSANRGITIAAVSTRRPVLSIRPRTTFNGLTNRGTLHLLDVDTTVTTNNAVLVELVVDGTLGGGTTWNDVNTSRSLAQVDTASTTITGGRVIASYYIPASANGATKGANAFSPDQLSPLSLDIAGTVPDNLSVVMTDQTGGTSNALAAMTWRETR